MSMNVGVREIMLDLTDLREEWFKNVFFYLGYSCVDDLNKLVYTPV